MTTKRDRAIRAMADKLDLRDATFGLGDALDAADALAISWLLGELGAVVLVAVAVWGRG